jgi:phosphopantothenoylcysteine decarboxylase/phosphopantothenate--cysteine ligase
VGFAAETQNLLGYAREKMQNKRLDMIVANDVARADSGFNSDRNAATILWADGSREVPLTTKGQLARLLIETLAEQWQERRGKVA